MRLLIHSNNLITCNYLFNQLGKFKYIFKVSYFIGYEFTVNFSLFFFVVFARSLSYQDAAWIDHFYSIKHAVKQDNSIQSNKIRIIEFGFIRGKLSREEEGEKLILSENNTQKLLTQRNESDTYLESMYHDALKVQTVQNSFRHAPNSMKEVQQRSSAQYPFSNKGNVIVKKNQQNPLPQQHTQISPSPNASGASTQAALSSQSNLAEPFQSSPKQSPVKITSTKAINIAYYGQEDSDTPIVQSKSFIGGKDSHYSSRNDSETSNGTSESLSGCTSNSIPSDYPKQKSQQQQGGGDETPKINKQGEQKQQIQQGTASIPNFESDDTNNKISSIPTTASGILKETNQNKNNSIEFLREIPMGSREAMPFEYIYEWNTYLSDSLLIKFMKQKSEVDQLSMNIGEQEEESLTNSTNSFKKKDNSAASNNPLITNSATEIKDHVVGIKIKENEQIIEVVKTNRHIITTLTLSVRKTKKISKKKSQIQFSKNRKYSHSKDELNIERTHEGFDLESDQISNQREGKRKSSSQQISLKQQQQQMFIKRHSSQQENKRKYYYQDPEIENYVGSEFQAVIPDIIPGYRPKLYSLKYDHSKFTNEQFLQVVDQLQETYGNHVTEEDAANIIADSGYDMNRVNELLEDRKSAYEAYFIQQKKLQNQRKGQIKRIGTLKRKRKNVLTL